MVMTSMLCALGALGACASDDDDDDSSDGSSDGMSCSCDIDYSCTAGCACDVECEPTACACDTDYSCTAGCACDAECGGGGSAGFGDSCECDDPHSSNFSCSNDCEPGPLWCFVYVGDPQNPHASGSCREHCDASREGEPCDEGGTCVLIDNPGYPEASQWVCY